MHVFKYILSFLGVLFSLIPLLIVALSIKNLSPENLVMCSSYPMMIVAGIWYFRLNIILEVAKTEIVN